MTPKILKAYVKAHEIKMKQEDESQWRHNSYTFEAVMTALDKGFNGRKAKCEYPSEPHYMSNAPKEIEGEVMSRERRDNLSKAKLLFAQLEVMKENYDIAHAGDNADSMS